MNPPTCPYCTKPATLTTGAAIYPHRPDLSEKKFWRCVACRAYVGCHRHNARVFVGGTYAISDGTLPLGRLANAELRKTKQAAHAAFDPLWRSGDMSRAMAYGWLSDKLGIPYEQCHIGMFDIDQCKAVIAAVKERTK
jgi:hypothetical protein